MWSRPVVQCIGRMSYISFTSYPTFHVRVLPKFIKQKIEEKRCSFAGRTKFGPFIGRRGPRKLCYLGLGAGRLILWDTSVTRVNGRFASDQPCYSSIYHLQLCSSDQVMTYHIHPKYLFFCFKSESFRKGIYWQELNYVYNCQNSPVHP